MSEANETCNGNGAVVISDDEIRRSLLGCASASEQSKFETQLLLDDHLEQRVQRLELELADDFSFGRLTQTERELFSKNFLVTSKRARDLAVSRAIHEAIVVGQPQQRKSGWQYSWLPGFARQRPFASAAITVIVIALVGFASWRVLKTRTVRPPLIAKQVPVVNPGREYAHPPSNNDAGTTSETERRIVASLTLQADNESSPQQTLHWSTPAAEQDRVRLDLIVDGETTGVYKARLIGRGGQITAHHDLNLQAGEPAKVSFIVAPILLPSGDYHIELDRSAEGKVIETRRYSFRSQED